MRSKISLLAVAAVSGGLVLASTPRPVQAMIYSDTCHQMCTYTSCQYAPPYISNGAPGDLVVHAAESPVALLIGLIGQSLTHSGILLDWGYNFRHNVADIHPSNLDDLITTNLTAFDGFLGMGSVDYGDVYIDSDFLARPGEMRSQNITYWYRPTTHLVKYSDYSAAQSTRINMTYSGLGYHLGAYADQAREAAKSGSHCSGSIALNAAPTGKGFSTPWYYMSTSSLQAGWDALYAQVRAATYESDRSGDLDSQGRSNIAKTVADQIMNCLRFGATELKMLSWSQLVPACYRLNKNWRDHGSFYARAVTPQDLTTQYGDAWQNATVPAQFAGGYYHSCYESTDWTCYNQCLESNGDDGSKEQPFQSY